MTGWDESKHKRDVDGKFAEQNSKNAYAAEVAKATLKDKGIDISKLTAKQTTEKYSETVGKTGRYETESGEKQAKINIQLFSAKLADQSEKELRKSKRSFEKRIREHEEKIANPKASVESWDSMTEQEKDGLINYWRKEIKEATSRLTEAKERINEPKE